MKRIGLISDTHSHWDERYEKYFDGCDEIWHAGDIGSYDIVTQLEKIAPLRANQTTATTKVAFQD